MKRWRRSWPPSRIGLRLLAFNLLLVFVPVAGVLYLDVYESRLLEAQEREMVQQARFLASAVSAAGRLDVDGFNRILLGLEGRNTARFRLFDPTGALVADSATFRTPLADATYGRTRAGADVRRRRLYRIGAWIVNTRQSLAAAGRRIFAARTQNTQPAAISEDRPELRAALEGRYGATTRQTAGERSLTLFSAVPVRAQGTVIGAVLASQSTFDVLQSVYEVRLRIFEIVVASVLAAAVLTTLAAMTIVKPLRRLRRQATALAERRRPLTEPFPGTDRTDELGDVARAVQVLTRRLDAQIHLLEGFAADVAHEFKNSLASIRTAAEMAGQAEEKADRDRFLTLMLRDVDRLERLVSGAREAAMLDGELGSAARDSAELNDVLIEAAGRFSDRGPSVRIDGLLGPVRARGTRERLLQVFENLLANAVSFAPAESVIDVTVHAESDKVHVAVADRGPGIPGDHLDRIFDRFFSYRPGSRRGDHVGLGLSIARRIVEGYDGTLTVRNREDGGAVFDVVLVRVSGR